MLSALRSLLRAEDGVTAIEYALIASLVSVVIVGAVTALGNGIASTLYNKIGAAL